MRRLAAVATLGAAIAAGGAVLWRRGTIPRRPRWPALAQRLPNLPGLRRGPKDWVGPYLRERDVAYEIQHHPVAYTAQEVAASEHISGRQVAKVVMVRADGRPAMLVLPAVHQVDLSRAATALGAQDVRLAQEDEFAALFPDCAVGAMPPFGERYGVPVYVDPSLVEAERIVCPAGTHTDTVSLRYADFERVTRPTGADFRALHG